MDDLKLRILRMFITAVNASLAALGLGVLRVDLSFGTLWSGYFLILSAIEYNSTKIGE